jgi:protocatechuate 3,4-dioxygenase beta subunit
MTDDRFRPVLLTRRATVLGGGALIAAAPGLVRAAPAIPPSMCVVTPRTTEGPFWFDPDLNRADIVEDRPGTPLALRIRVVDAGDGCAPISGARVDVWQCDAGGLYSGYSDQGFAGGIDVRGEAFLRGWQAADADGMTRFRTIYPGTYPTRVTHIHVKAFLNDREALTAQIYFPEDVTRAVYRAADTYATSVPNVRANDSDFIFRRGGDTMVAETGEANGVLTATVTIGVRA